MPQENRTMNLSLQRSALISFIILMLFTVGCASTKSSRFYTLNSIKGPAAEQMSPVKSPGAVVSIGHVEIPNIIDRPQLVTYSGDNQVEFNEFDRWAGSIKDDISRVLIEDLSIMIVKDGISIVSWREPVSADYRIDLNITKFGSVSDREVVLSARWIVLQGEEKKVIHIYESSLSESTEGRGRAAEVAAMSRALEKLSRELSDFILKMLAECC